jgi:hypothetical protein
LDFFYLFGHRRPWAEEAYNTRWFPDGDLDVAFFQNEKLFAHLDSHEVFCGLRVFSNRSSQCG